MSIRNSKSKRLMPEILKLMAIEPKLTYKEMVERLDGGVGRDTLAKIRRSLGLTERRMRRKSRMDRGGNWLWELPWKEYVKVPGTLVWGYEDEPIEVHHTCCLGVLLQRLEVG